MYFFGKGGIVADTESASSSIHVVYTSSVYNNNVEPSGIEDYLSSS